MIITKNSLYLFCTVIVLTGSMAIAAASAIAETSAPTASETRAIPNDLLTEKEVRNLGDKRGRHWLYSSGTERYTYNAPPSEAEPNVDRFWQQNNW